MRGPLLPPRGHIRIDQGLERTIRKFALPGRRVAETRDHAGIVLPADEDHNTDQKQDDERQFLEQSGVQSVIHRPGIGQRG